MQYIFEKDLERKTFKKIGLKIEADSLEEAQRKMDEGDWGQENISYEHDGKTIEDGERKVIDSVLNNIGNK